MATILIVDDEPDILLLTQLNLERDGHRIVTAGNGSAALAAVQEAAPDLILLDVMLPDGDQRRTASSAERPRARSRADALQPAVCRPAGRGQPRSAHREAARAARSRLAGAHRHGGGVEVAHEPFERLLESAPHQPQAR